MYICAIHVLMCIVLMRLSKDPATKKELDVVVIPIMYDEDEEVR